MQLLLPLADRSDASKDSFEGVLDELTSKFGGATAFLNSPAQGLWENDGQRECDRIITVEVMVEDFDAQWWSRYRESWRRPSIRRKSWSAQSRDRRLPMTKLEPGRGNERGSSQRHPASSDIPFPRRAVGEVVDDKKIAVIRHNDFRVADASGTYMATGSL